VLHISIWVIEAFSEVLSGNGTERWAPCDSGPPQLGGTECGWYGFAHTRRREPIQHHDHITCRTPRANSKKMSKVILWWKLQ